MAASVPDIPLSSLARLLPATFRRAPWLAALGLLLYLGLTLLAGHYWVDRQVTAFLLQGRFYADMETELVAGSLVAKLGPIRSITMTVAQQPAVIQILDRQSRATGDVAAATLPADRRQLQPLLDFIADAGVLTGVALVDAKGRVLEDAIWSDLVSRLGENIAGQKYFRDAQIFGFSTAVIADEQNRRGRFLLAMAINDETGRFVGVVIAHMRMPEVKPGLGVDCWFLTDVGNGVVQTQDGQTGRPRLGSGPGRPCWLLNLRSHPQWPWLQQDGGNWFIRSDRDLGLLGLTLHVVDRVDYVDARNHAVLDVVVFSAMLGLTLIVIVGTRFYIGRIRQTKKGLREAVAALQSANEQLTVLATVDALTGAINRYHFIERARYEVARATRYRQPLSVAMIDADHFKNVNDTVGHAGGDAVLRDLVSICKSQLRETDLLGRYGGEEFIVLLPGTPVEAAGTLAERLRRAIEQHMVITPGGWMSYTVSLGVAGFDGVSSTTLEDLMAQADAALYDAKHRGRNRVALHAAGSAVQADPAAGI